MEEVYSKVLMKHSTFSKLGNCFAVFVNNKVFILVGPHWPFMAFIIPFILAILVGYIVMLAPHMSLEWQLGGTIIIMAALGSYTATALKDPGVVLSDICASVDEDTTVSSTLCKICMIYKEDNTEHCEDCGLCMQNLDHHCIFTGKCIAQKNLHCFYLMLASVFGFFMYTIAWVLVELPQK
jgi:DHHC palmitoyltransferase